VNTAATTTMAGSQPPNQMVVPMVVIWDGRLLTWLPLSSR
jgi:hypothetical protein